MRENGSRHSQRPRIELHGAAEPLEAAAVVAAVEEFLADTAPAPARREAVSAWQRVALAEGVGAKTVFGPPAPNRRDRWQ